jgi:hypothetical protein
MSILDRQRKREQQAAQLQANRQGITSAEGQRMQQSNEGPRPSVRDVPTGDMATYGPETKTPLGETPGADVPFDPAKFEEHAKNAQEAYTKVLPSAEYAVRIGRAAKDMGKEAMEKEEPGKWDRVMRSIRLFKKENPGAIQNYLQQEELASWTGMNVDVEPHESSAARKERNRAATARMYSFAPGISERHSPQELDYEEGSRDDVLRNKEKEGMDTTTGFGDFSTVFRGATEFNSPRARAAFMEAAVREELQIAGIEVPPEIPVVKLDEDLNQLVYMRPTEEGKVKWTLGDSEMFRPEDLGMVADLPTLFSLAGAAAANLAPKGRITKAFFARHPFIGEYIGDLGGRQLGTILEYLVSMGEVTPEELQNALTGNHITSLVETTIGRGTGRLIEKAWNTGKLKVEAGQEDAAQEAIDEAADVLTDMERLTEGGPSFGVGAAEASDDVAALQTAKGRAKNATRRQKEAREQIELENIESLRVANRNTAKAALDTVDETNAGSVSYSPEETARRSSNAVAKHRENMGKIQKNEDFVKDPETGRIRSETHEYYVEGDKMQTRDHSTGKPLKPTEQIEPAWTVIVDHEDGTIMLRTAYEGARWRGASPQLMDNILDDLLVQRQDLGDYVLMSDSSVSAEAVRMMERLADDGWGIRLADPDHVMMTTPDGDILPYRGNEDVAFSNLSTNAYNRGVFVIETIPGRKIRNPIDEVEFDQYAMEEMVEDAAALLPAAEARAAEQTNFMKAAIGWSEQKQTSNIKVANPSSSPIRQTVRRIQNRSQQAIEGMSQREADQRLAAVTTRETDEEGVQWLSGLADEELDYGQLTKAHAKLRQLAKETEDPDVISLLQQVESRLSGKTGKWFNQNGDEVTGAARNNIGSAWENAYEGQKLVEEAAARVNGKNLFARSVDGQLINTSLTAMRKYLGNATNFLRDMKPVLKMKPEMELSAKQAIGDIYQEDVLATGWTRSKHNTFMKKYSTAIETLWNPEKVAELKRWDLTSQGNQFKADVNASREVFERIKKRHGWVNEKGEVEYPAIDGDNLLGSIQKMGPRKAKFFLKDLEEVAPEMVAQYRRNTIKQTEQQLNDIFFDVESGTGDVLGRYKGFKKWFTNNKDALRATHGDQYVTDLETMTRALQLEARRARVAGFAPDAQPNWLRATRSLLGPLSRPQRQLTAGTYIQQRVAAAKVLQIISDPQMMRELMVARKLPAKSRAGIAVGTRLGLFAEFGVVPENDQFFETGNPEHLDERYVNEARKVIDQAMESEYMGWLDDENLEQPK